MKKLLTNLNVHLELGFRNSAVAVERRDVVVAIDVLRCSSSTVTALANGAKAVIPSLTLNEARALAKARGAILAGERKGRRPKGFQLGNSPLEFKEKVVHNRTIVLHQTDPRMDLTEPRT